MDENISVCILYVNTQLFFLDKMFFYCLIKDALEVGCPLIFFAVKVWKDLGVLSMW